MSPRSSRERHRYETARRRNTGFLRIAARAIFLIITCAVVGSSGSVVTPACLSDAIPVEERQNITIRGVSMPLGVIELGWASATLLSKIYRVLVEEVLGYRTTGKSVGASIYSFYLLAGCEDPAVVANNKDCRAAVAGRVSRDHVALEAWHGGNQQEIERMQKAYPTIWPTLVGSIGFSGNEGMHVLGPPKDSALVSEGLALDFYASYNASWHESWKYFNTAKLSTVNASLVQDCKDTPRMAGNEYWQNYVTVTGDIDGVEIGSDNSYRAKCLNEKFWLAPACRADPEKCIVLFSGGDGWSQDAFAQKAAKFNMPVALATAPSWSQYLVLPRKYVSLLYWWTPDTSFVDLSPSRIVFPDNSKRAWNSGDKSTASENVYCGKWVHQELERVAPRLFELAKRFTTETSQVTDLLLDKKESGDSDDAVACRWVKANQDIWKDWILDERTCSSGSGLVALDGSFVENRSLASGCRPCMPGTYSYKVDAKTFVCRACAPGSSQPEPLQSSCVPCEAGKVSSSWKQRECQPCAQGTYQNSSNMSSCDACPQPMTTVVLGSATRQACICPEGTFKPKTSVPQSASACQPCKEGMRCPQASFESNFPRSQAEVQSKQGKAYPSPLPGYYTEFSDPLSVFKCQDVGACPGGDSEVCGPNSIGLACATCMDGYYRSKGTCMKCTDVEKSQFLFPTIPLLLGPLIVYALHRYTRDPVEKWGNSMNSVQAAFYLVLVYLQILASLQTCYINAPSIFSNTYGWADSTYELLSLLRPDCAVIGNFAAMFIVKLFLPLYALAVFGLTYALSKILVRLRQALYLDRDIVFNNYMSVFYTFFIGIAAQTISLWQCYQHPNGLSSLMSAPSVLCYADVWNSLVAVSIVASLLFCVGSLCLFTFIICVAPRSFHNETFRKRWKFLFIKFRPDVYWWGVVLLLKGVWLPLATVLFLFGARQVAWLCFMVLGYLIGCFALLPWRSYAVAVLDVIMHACLLFLFAFVPHFTKAGDVSLQELGIVSVVTASLPLLASAVIVVSLLYQHLGGRCPLLNSAVGMPRSHKETVQQIFDAFNALKDPEQLSKAWDAMPAADRIQLNQAKNIIRHEVCGDQFLEASWSRSRLTARSFCSGDAPTTSSALETSVTTTQHLSSESSTVSSAWASVPANPAVVTDDMFDVEADGEVNLRPLRYLNCRTSN